MDIRSMIDPISGFQKSLEDIQVYYDRLKQDYDETRQKLLSYNKDEEIAKLRQEKDDICDHALLILSDKEQKDIRDFIHTHYERHNGGQFKAIGNSYMYTLTGTGVGTMIEITCPICGESKDVTDISCW